MARKQRRNTSRSGQQAAARTPHNARELAFVVLSEHKRSGDFATRLLEDRLAILELPSSDRRLATELVYGVVRRQLTLNALIEPHVRRPRQQVEGELWTLMQLGAYQLTLLQTSPHAALNETVNAAKRLGKPRWSGFLNGVLRSVERGLTDKIIDEPSAEALPLNDGRFRGLASEVFPDPQSDPAGYLSRAFSFPPQISLRVNHLKIDREGLLEALEEAGVTARPGVHSEAVRIDGPVRIEQLPGFAEGWFMVQDEAAMQAAILLDPQPGEHVLDLCAAPGTKTTHLAERMQNSGTILATDTRTHRLRLVEENCRRLGIETVTTQVVGADGGDVPPGPFDAVLVDVPCSNTGVLGKRPEARWRIEPADFDELPELQSRLLRLAVERLKPAGRVVYSTCSIEPEENIGVVQRVLRENPGLTLDREIEHLPGKPADGGYLALLRRETSAEGTQ